MKWQCVEYVRRYYYIHYDMDLFNLGGGMDAWQFFGNAANMHLSDYANGDTTAPQVGDILCFGGNGHVAIIRDVSSTTVTVIQQNWTEDSGDENYTFTMTVSNGTYWIEGLPSLPVQGWLRKTTSPSFTYNLAGNYSFNLISFPFTPKAGTSRKFSAIFQSLGTDLFQYVFYINDDGSIGYDLTSNLDAVGKKGYFIFLQNAKTCQVTGNAVDPTVTLHAGWNAVGVTSATVPASNSHVSPTAYYVDSAGTLQATSIFVNGLQPGFGYFICCDADNVTLVPSTGASQLAQKDVTRPAVDSGTTSIGTDFSCQVTVSQTSAGASPLTLNFGMKPGASDGFDDGLDELAAPPLPGNITVTFDESFGLKSSYRASSSSASWPLIVRSESPDTGAVNTNPMVISWVIPLAGTVDPNTLFELLDSQGNVLVSDMRRTTQTSFSVAASSTERHFTIRASLAGPILSVTPSGDLLSGGNPGGPFSPPSQTYTVGNSGVGTLNWTVSANQNWVTVTPTNGTNAGTVTIAINSNANSLPGGVGGVLYTATLTFGGNGGTVTRHMNLVVYQGNHVPQVAVSTPQGTQSGRVPISFLIYDDESDLCSIQVQYSANGGGTWHAATPGLGSCGTSGLSSSPNGDTHLYVWDSVADLGYVANSSVEIQMTPTDPGGTGWTIATSSFTVDNTAVLPPPTPISPGTASPPGPVLRDTRVTFAWTAVPGAAGYRCYAYDAESHNVTQWTVTGGATNCQLWLSSFPHLANLHWYAATINSNDVEGASSSSCLYFQTPPPNISVTVQANPSGRSFTVDGMTFNYTVFFSWVPGSDHTISTTSPQSGAAGVQYVWQNWSDGEGMTHIVTPTVSTTYTASFTTQFNLTMNMGTGGSSISPGSGWYNSGSIVNISATAIDGYIFNYWNGTGLGSYTGSNSSDSITMNEPITELASFILNPLNIPIDFIDYSIFASHWMESSCAMPDWCEGTDFDQNGRVDLFDLSTFAEYWLSGIE